MAETSALGLLRAIHDDELELMLDWRNSPGVRANMFTHHEISLDEHRAWWALVRERDDQNYFMYEYLGKPSGVVAFKAWDKVNETSSWAFYAAPDAARGSGSRMEFLALDHAFADMQLHKLHCEVLAFNGKVIALHQKFGFKVEGVFREQHKADDVFVDIYRLGILADEWGMHRSALYQKLNRKAIV